MVAALDVLFSTLGTLLPLDKVADIPHTHTYRWMDT